MGVIMDVKKDKKPLSKYFNMTTLVMSLAILAGVSLYTMFNVRSKYQLQQAQLESTKYMYNIVLKERNRLDSLKTFYINSITLRDSSIAFRERELGKKDTEIASLRKSLSNALAEASTTTASESYTYINNRIPATAPKIYPFDSTQVKTIHKTFLERDGYISISVGLDSLVKNLKLLSFTKDNQIGELKSLNNVYLQEKQLCEGEKGSVQIENQGLKKEAKHQKNMKTVSNVGILGLIVVIIAIIL